MSNLNNINEQHLDNLLKEVYLQAHANVVNEQEANFVFNQNYTSTINLDKEKEFLNKLYTHTVIKKRYVWLSALLFITALIIAIIVFLYTQYSPTNASTKNFSQQLITKTDKEPLQTNNQNLLENQTSIILKPIYTFPKIKLVVLAINDSIMISQSITSKIKQQNAEQTMPYLTKKDKINYSSIKQQMLRNLSTLNKDFYTKVPANKINYIGKPNIVDAFNMRNVCVSNLEYKVFLADLIIQNKTTDYFKAQVFSELWSKYNCNQIADNYFQNDAYNDFPVVNITQEGAVLFCKWLQEEFEMYAIQYHLKNIGLKIRLPYSHEWISAARDGYAKITFEKGYHVMYDTSEGLVDKTFANRQEKIKRKNQQSDSLYSYMIINYYGLEEASIIAILNKGLSYYPYAEKDTVNPSKMKVLNKFYKISEIVCQTNSQKYWLSGQTWKDKNEYLKLEQEFKNNTCSPFVGFRFMVINPTDPEYKNPFW